MCAALRPAASHRVSGGAACPRRLYYTRYYTGAAICMSRPTGDVDPEGDDLPHKYLGRDKRGGAVRHP